MQILSFRSLESVWDLDMGVWNFSAVLPRFSSLCPWSSALIDSISLLTVQGKSRGFLRARRMSAIPMITVQKKAPATIVPVLLSIFDM